MTVKDLHCITIKKEEIGELKLIQELSFKKEYGSVLVFEDKNGEYYLTENGDYTELCNDLFLVKISEIKEDMEVLNYYEPDLEDFFEKVEATEIPQNCFGDFFAGGNYHHRFFVLKPNEIYLQHARDRFHGLVFVNLKIEEDTQKGEKKLIRHFPNLKKYF